jgi:hypothetical protein
MREEIEQLEHHANLGPDSIQLLLIVRELLAIDPNLAS